MDESMTEKPPIRLRICPECDAAGNLQQVRCWLCGHAFGDGTEAPPVLDAELMPQQQTSQSSLSTFLMAATLFCVGVGAALVEPGFGIILAVVSIPAWIATAITTRKFETQGKPLGWLGRTVAFVISAIISYMVVIAILAVVAVAVFIAFAIFCFYAMINING